MQPKRREDWKMVLAFGRKIKGSLVLSIEYFAPSLALKD